MQLVQTSAHDVRIEARSIRKAREEALALRRQESHNEKMKEPWLDEHDKEVSKAILSPICAPIDITTTGDPPLYVGLGVRD